VALFEQRDEFVGVAQAVGGRDEGRRALGRVAAQGHDVAEAVVVEFLRDIDELGA